MFFGSKCRRKRSAKPSSVEVEQSEPLTFGPDGKHLLNQKIKLNKNYVGNRTNSKHISRNSKIFFISLFVSRLSARSSGTTRRTSCTLFVTMRPLIVTNSVKVAGLLAQNLAATPNAVIWRAQNDNKNEQMALAFGWVRRDNVNRFENGIFLGSFFCSMIIEHEKPANRA